MRYRPFFVAAMLGAVLTMAVGPQAFQAQASPTNPYLFPYNQGTNISYNISDVTAAWQQWKSTTITSNNAGGGGRLRVMGGTDSGSTVSEGQGYGILFSSIFDEQSTLDGLWLFARDHLDKYGLMHWHIGSPGQLIGEYAATDGDEDMALGLMNACIKVRKGAWSNSPYGIDYCSAATSMINAIYQYEVDKPGSEPPAGLSNNQGGELLPGDAWLLTRDYPEGIVNLSYFSPGYFTAFGKFTGNTSGWNTVNARNYAITNLAQGKAGNCSKLISNWNQYDGDPQTVSWQPDTSHYWGWDAARFAWRIAVDKAWYNTANARETMNEVGGFFSSVGISNVRAQYRLDGTSIDSYHSTYFVAHAASAIWAAPSPNAVNCGAATGSLKTSPQQAYNEVLNTKEQGGDGVYYNNSWRLFAMLLMTGNFPNFYEMANSTTPTATPVVPTATPVVPTATPVVPPTATPVVPPTATPVVPPTATPVVPTATPVSGASCQVSYVVNQWNTGFTANVTIKNTGSSTVSGWTLAWTFPNSQQVTNAWNTTLTQSGASVTAKDAGWNGTIAPGGTSNFGFQANYSGSNATPSNFTLNGAACSVAP
ncbi:glycoside hydrolase [Chloroflexia bacterium SDU3-3]|nr:glycoside hydrolase [Chloroflexia bacterium SDU3-3]